MASLIPLSRQQSAMLFPWPFIISMSLRIPTISSALYVFRGIFHHSFVLFYHDFSLQTIGSVFGGQVTIFYLLILFQFGENTNLGMYTLNATERSAEFSERHHKELAKVNIDILKALGNEGQAYTSRFLSPHTRRDTFPQIHQQKESLPIRHGRVLDA